eukprot:3776495-Pleurochrysis_carterae.AAC.1
MGQYVINSANNQLCTPAVNACVRGLTLLPTQPALHARPCADERSALSLWGAALIEATASARKAS